MLRSKLPKMTAAGIIVYRGKAYIPTRARLIGSGLIVDQDPVYVANLDAHEIKEALQKVLAAGNALIPEPGSREEFKQKITNVIPRAAKISSWNRLKFACAGYTIHFMEDKACIFMNRFDKQGRLEPDSDKDVVLPADASLDTISEIILQDILKRPEALT